MHCAAQFSVWQSVALYLIFPAAEHICMMIATCLSAVTARQRHNLRVLEKAVVCVGGCCNIISGYASRMQDVQLESRSSTITSNSPPPSASVHSARSTLYQHYPDQRTPLSPTTHQPASNTFHYAHYYVTLHMSHIPFRLHCLRPVGRVTIRLDLGRWGLVVLHGVAGG